MLVIVKHSHRMWKLIALLFVGAFVSVVRSTRCRCQAPPQGDLTLASGCSSGDFMEEIDLYIQKECDIEDTCGRATKRVYDKSFDEKVHFYIFEILVYRKTFRIL